MRIAICNQKGGSGKTTATVLLAYALGAAGKKVGVLDLDPQATATKWIGMAPGEGVEMAQPGRAYDVVFMDTPGYLDHPGFAKSLLEADRIVLVCSTSPVDVWSTQAAAEYIAKERPDIRLALLFTRFEGWTEFGRARDDFANALRLPALKNAIPERKSIQRAAVQGFKSLPPADREVLARVAIEILTL